jgi:sugar lactone lactonase YvrE
MVRRRSSVFRRFGLGLLILLLLAAATTVVVSLIHREKEGRVKPTRAGWTPAVRLLAGDGSPGFWNGIAVLARFSDPFGMVMAHDGTVYVSDAGDNNRIRTISADGRVSTLAGGEEGFSDGVGATARFHTPSGLALDARGFLYVADTGNHAIRRVTPDGEVSTIAGDGLPGYRNGPAAAARFNGPVGVAVDRLGNVYVADTYNDRIRRIGIDGEITTIAGAGTPGYLDGPAAVALFDTPSGLTFGNDGTLFIADTANNAVRTIGSDGEVRTLMTTWIDGGGFIPSAPSALAQTSDGFLYVGGYGDGRIVQVAPDGVSRLISGLEQPSRLASAAALAVGRDGSLRVTDSRGYAVWHLLPLESSIASEAAEDRLPLLSWRRVFGDDGLRWPVDHGTEPPELTATLAEVRGSTARSLRLNGGVDIQADEGSPVRAVRPEKVRSPVGAYGVGGDNEWLTLDLTTYVHFRIGRTRHGAAIDPARFLIVRNERDRVTGVRVRRGTRFDTGEILGTVNRLHHVHLEVGRAGDRLNPLLLPFPPLVDTIPPTLVRDGIRLFDEAGTRLTERQAKRLVVRGRVSIVVEAYDRVDNNLPRRRLGLYELGYQILREDGTPAPEFEQPVVSLVFDRLPSGPGAAEAVYWDGSGIVEHVGSPTRFRYRVTSTVGEGTATSDLWDSAVLPPGDYVLRIIARDFAGNEAASGRDLPIRIANGH